MMLCIVGPTGVGKTKLSVELAKKYNAIVVNGDSMQVYKELNIGTAKVTEEEKEGIEHKLFDIVNPTEMYTVYDYQKDLRDILDNNKNKNVIIVGGTGLYIKALLYDYRFNKEEDSHKYDNLTNDELLDKIYKINPNSMVDKNNNRRLIRELINLENGAENKTGDNLLYDNVYFIGLTVDRSILYDRINKRVDIMLKSGLEDEAKYFYNKNRNAKSLRTVIGYKELFLYFDKKISKEEAIDLIKKNSRHYAKRQYTWFNNKLNLNWFNVDFNNFDNTINDVENKINDYFFK